MKRTKKDTFTAWPSLVTAALTATGQSEVLCQCVAHGRGRGRSNAADLAPDSSLTAPSPQTLRRALLPSTTSRARDHRRSPPPSAVAWRSVAHFELRHITDCSHPRNRLEQACAMRLAACENMLYNAHGACDKVLTIHEVAATPFHPPKSRPLLFFISIDERHQPQLERVGGPNLQGHVVN